MDNSKLKTAILGLNEKGRVAIKTASQIEHFLVQAVADKNIGLAEESSSKYNCTAYDDYRQLITQNDLDCLIVAEDMHHCEEYLRMAINKKINILKLPPLARNFDEATQLVSLAKEQNIKFAVANTSRFATGFIELRKMLGLIDEPAPTDKHPEQTSAEKPSPFLVTAEYYATKTNCPDSNPDEPPVWASDIKLSGGGILLYNCYEIIDQMIYNFGLPQQVYSLNLNTTSDKRQRQYLTEDTAIITIKFNESLFGNIIATKNIGVSEEKSILKIFTGKNIIEASRNALITSDYTNQTRNKTEYDNNESDCLQQLLKNFALSILSPDKNKLSATAKDNLYNMAVIESAYLSARTGFPEEPAKIMKLPQFEPANIWPTNK